MTIAEEKEAGARIAKALGDIVSSATDAEEKKKIEDDIRANIYVFTRMKGEYEGKSTKAGEIKALVQEASNIDPFVVSILARAFPERMGGRRMRTRAKKTKKTKKASKKTRRR